MKFGLLTYRNTMNLGDEIQSVAAQRLLPRVDVYLDRDLPDDSLAETSGPVAVIMNGWYGHRPEGWPPPSSVVPLLISMHISHEVFPGLGKLGISPAEYFVGKAGEYLKRWGPVGTRDLNTLNLLKKHNIPSYFSGCLTLTLQRQDNINHEDFVACVDLPNDLIAVVQQRTRRPVVTLSHLDTRGSAQERMRRAENLLTLYQKAHCVITTRLHCALPCLAIEAPVLLIDTASDQYRFEGLNLLIRHCEPSEFLENRCNFDIDSPPPNNLDYLKFRKSLIQRAQSFMKDAPRLFKVKRFSAKETLSMRFDTLWAQHAELRQTADLAIKKSHLLEGQLESVVSERQAAIIAENERQREAAARAEEVIAGLRQELALIQQRLVDFSNERVQLRQSLATSEETLAQLRAEAAQLRETVKTSEQLVSRLQQELASSVQNISEVNFEREQLRAALGAVGAEAAELRETAKASEQLVPRLQQELSSSVQNVSELNLEKERLLAALADTRAEAAELRETVTASEQLVSRLQQELTSSVQKISELNLDREQLRAALKVAGAEAAQLRETVMASEQLVPRLQQELSSSVQKISELNLEKELLRATLEVAVTESGQLGERVTASERIMSRLRDEIGLLQQRMNSLLADATRSRNVESELERKLSVLNSEKIKAARVFKQEKQSFNRVISSLREQILALNAHATALSESLNEMVSSTSWKLTTPIRVIGRRVPHIGRLSKKVFHPMLRQAYIALGRKEPVFAWNADIPRQVEKILHSELLGRGSAQSDIETSVESPNLSLPQTDIVTAFGSIQNRLGRSVFLVAADAPPMFDKHAGGLRLYNLVRMFRDMGWRIVFASQSTLEHFTSMAGSAEDRTRYEEMLYDTGVEQIAYGSQACETLIRTLGADLNWAFLSFPGVAQEFIPQVRIYAPWANVIYDMVDFHALRMSRQAQLTSDGVLQAEAERMQAIELANARTADVTVAVSEAERQAMLELDPNLVVEVIPTMFDLPSDIRFEIDERNGLFFVGGFWHTPNVDAVMWFAQKVWPLILKQRPDMIFRVAGSNPSEQIIALRGQPGIEVLGYVSELDLTHLFVHSRMSVAPMRYGAGVKGKVGQSMAYGLPVVATSVGAEGMTLENGKHLLIADTPDEFAAAVLRLATDDDLWLRLHANGRRFVEEFQSMDVVRDKLRTLVNG